MEARWPDAVGAAHSIFSALALLPLSAQQGQMKLSTHSRPSTQRMEFLHWCRVRVPYRVALPLIGEADRRSGPSGAFYGRQPDLTQTHSSRNCCKTLNLVLRQVKVVVVNKRDKSDKERFFANLALGP